MFVNRYAKKTGKDHTVGDAGDELKHALEVHIVQSCSHEPASPFSCPHFTGAYHMCVTENTVWFRESMSTLAVN